MAWGMRTTATLAPAMRSARSEARESGNQERNGKMRRAYVNSLLIGGYYSILWIEEEE